jgi:hypothetical protein
VNGSYWPGHGQPGPAPTSQLYRNGRDGIFENVTEACGLAEV